MAADRKEKSSALQQGNQIPWQTLTIEETAQEVRGDVAQGLAAAEAQQRLAHHGPNQLREEKEDSFLEEFVEELREPMILLLLGTGVLYAVWGKLSDAITIFLVILTLNTVEVLNELRAKKAVKALRQLAEPTALVRREGVTVEVPSTAVVPGDLLVLQAGRRVPADGRLVASYGLAADESALTGEAVPVDKEAAAVYPPQTPLAEQHNLIHAGSVITRGRGSALVTATGMSTELGQVAGLAREVKEPQTPLQKAMNEVSRSLVWLALAFSLLVPLLGWGLAGQPLRQMLLTGLSLAFATIPEEMPIIITMVLALGAYRLSREHAIAKRLRAVETLGAVTVIATDKTGTLTQNRMQVTAYAPENAQRTLLEVGLLTNSALFADAAPAEGANGAAPRAYAGDPLDAGLARAAQEAGVELAPLRSGHALRDEFTFDNTRKRMSVAYATPAGLHIVAKGAPEAILTCCALIGEGPAQRALTLQDREAILAEAGALAAKGLRVLALAEKHTAEGPLSLEGAESALRWIGLLGYADPPRPEVRQAVLDCQHAGIRIIMVTGDHPLTAQAIARAVGLDGDPQVLSGPQLDALSDEELQEAVGRVSLYARTTPQHKLRIVQALRARGERVAVTGDGINDAPALAAADIGVAMGASGSDVAREAADIVLADDNFATIVRAAAEGRTLYANLTKGVRYYLACKVALVSASLLPVLLRVSVPFAPVQIILMELFMDLAASATFVAEPPEVGLMNRPPRDPRAPFMGHAMVLSILTSAIGLFAAVSVAYLATWYASADLARAQTVAFVTWLLGHVFLAVNMRSEREPLVRLGFFSNRLLVWWGLAAILFVLAATSVPGVNSVLRTTPLRAREWALVVGVSLAGTFWMEGLKLARARREHGS